MNLIDQFKQTWSVRVHL